MKNDNDVYDFNLSEKEISELFRAKIQKAILNQDMVSLKRLGFKNSEIQIICKQGTLAFDKLMNQSSRYLRANIKVEIDHDCFAEVLSEVSVSLDELTRIQKLISYEAPKAMMISLFGMSVEKFKFWRCVFGLEKRGRAPVPSEDQKLKIWEVWNSNLELNLVERLIRIYETTRVPLRSVWAEIHTWTEMPDRYRTFDHKSRFILKNKQCTE